MIKNSSGHALDAVWNPVYVRFSKGLAPKIETQIAPMMINTSV
jgi:hypothetical protein